MSRISHYLWFPDDFLSSPWVMACTLQEEGIYRRLLDQQWKHPGCQLPDDPPYIRRLCKNAKWEKILPVLEANFEKVSTENSRNFWRNSRLYSEFSRLLLKSEKARNSVNHRISRPTAESFVNQTIEKRLIESQSTSTSTNTKGEGGFKAGSMHSIAYEKATAAWDEFKTALERYDNGSRLIVQDNISRRIGETMGWKKIKSLMPGILESSETRNNFIDSYTELEIQRFKESKK